jgi:drug/metabolite transporter (DMT)-like permease
MIWKAWAALAVVCLWAASGWLIPAPSGDSLPELQRQGLGFAALAVVAVALGGFKRQRSGWKLRGEIAAAGALFFAVPLVLAVHAKEYAPETSFAVVSALAPVVVVLVWGAVAQESNGIRNLIPALMGLAGVLLLLPFNLPVSVRGWAALAEIAASMVFVAGAGVWMYRLLRRETVMEAIAIVGIPNAVCLFVWCGAVGSLDLKWRDVAGGLRWGWSVETVVAALTVWLLREIDPVRFSARFLVIPLVTIVEGLALLRPEVTGRMVGGMVLLSGGAAWILMTPREVDEEVLTLR